MKIKLIAGGVIILIILIILGQLNRSKQLEPGVGQIEPTPEPTASAEQVSIIAQGLDNPNGLALLPDNSILTIERKGLVRFIEKSGSVQFTPAAVLSQVQQAGNAGLLGIAINPDFTGNQFVYLYYTYNIVKNQTLSRVARMTFSQYRLINEKTIVDNIPGTINNPGGRIAFGPDGFLYITTGDTENPSQAQDTNSLAGKILRVTVEGLSVPGNNFYNLVYSLGHREPRGLAWDNWGNLWETEQGAPAAQGRDEINLIQSGVNYGWPDIQGEEEQDNMTMPFLSSQTANEWDPAGAALAGTKLFFGGLQNGILYEAVIENAKIKELKEHFKGRYLKITDVILGADGKLYFSTEDKILSVNPVKITD